MEIQHTQQLLRNLHRGGEVFARELVPKLLEDLGGQPSSEIAPPEVSVTTFFENMLPSPMELYGVSKRVLMCSARHFP